MNDYIEARFSLSPCQEEFTDILASLLADGGFESFVPDADGLTAYVSQRLYDRDAIDAAIRNFPIDGVTILFQTYRYRKQMRNPQLFPPRLSRGRI